jgi:hypothetical protein
VGLCCVAGECWITVFSFHSHVVTERREAKRKEREVKEAKSNNLEAFSAISSKH